MNDGARIAIRETGRIIDADHHVMEMFETHDGQDVRTMQIEYTRAKRTPGLIHARRCMNPRRRESKPAGHAHDLRTRREQNVAMAIRLPYLLLLTLLATSGATAQESDITIYPN